VELEGAGDLNLADIAGALGKPSHSALGIRALVVREGELPGLLVDQLKVADVSVSLPGKVEHLAVLVVVGHEDTSGGVEVLSNEGIFALGGFPDSKLAVRGFGETSGGESLASLEPDNTRSLHSLMSGAFKANLSGSDVEDTELLIAAGRNNGISVGAEGKGGDEVGVSEELDLLLAFGDVPKLDGKIPAGRGKGVVGGRVEFHLTNLAGVGSENGDRIVLQREEEKKRKEKKRKEKKRKERKEKKKRLINEGESEKT